MLAVPASLSQVMPTQKTLIDSAGRRVEIPSSVSRILPTGNPAAAAILSLAPNKLLGWFTPKPAPISEKTENYLSQLMDLEPLGYHPDETQCRALRLQKPDLILDYGTLTRSFIDRADYLQARIGCPVLMVDGRLSNTLETCAILGEALDAGAAARRLSNLFSRFWSRIHKSDTPRVGPKVYYALGADGSRTVRAGSIHLDALTALNAQLLPGVEAGDGGRVSVDLGAIQEWDPDIIITISRHFAEAVETMPQWQNISAVKSGKIYLAPEQLLSWFDYPPSLNRIIGLPWLAHILYPTLFSPISEADVQEFYEAAYDTVLNPEAVSSLLSRSMRQCAA